MEEYGKSAINDYCEKEFVNKLPRFEKVKDTMKGEKFEQKKYIFDMKMKDAQIYFKFRTHMTDVKFNYKNVQCLLRGSL